MISSLDEIIDSVTAAVDRAIASGALQESERADEHRRLCHAKAKYIYGEYHRLLPELKSTSREADRAAHRRGYVFTLSKRRRHLARDMSWLAFNSICQGSAADLIKSAMVRLAPRYCEKTRAAGAHLVASVHDELVFEAPAETVRSPSFVKHVVSGMETSPWELRVPLRASAGVSFESWADASSGEDTSLDRAYFEEEVAEMYAEAAA